MQIQNLKAKSVPVHDFSYNPGPDVKRSNFPIRQANTTAFAFARLIPLFWYDVLPGDHFNAKITAACRTAIPIAPILDNWTIDFFVYYIPYRLVWPNFVKMMGEQQSPGDSISYAIPTVESAPNGFPVNSMFDYLGLPTVGQTTAAMTVKVGSLVMRSYMLTYNTWFRDENLINWQGPTSWGDGPDAVANFPILRRGKRPDYFTTSLPWPQKGNAASTLPLGTSAVVIPNPAITPPIPQFRSTPDTAARQLRGTAGTTTIAWSANVQTTGAMQWENSSPTAATNTALIADLTTATAATINQLRTAITLQQLLEKDARGGTRYKEMVYSHYRVVIPDARVDRPEYIGGGSVPITVNAVPQTSATGLTGGTAPLGQLGATGYAIGTAGFSYAATEHGCILVLASARADLRYFQGVPRAFSKATRYDIYLPVLDGLGEQPILNKEIYSVGGPTGGTAAADQDMQVFGYGPRWDEYRHFPSRITGLMRPNATGNIGYWHSAQNFTGLPALNAAFIEDQSDGTIARNLSAGGLAIDQQVFGDFMVQGSVARGMSAYGIPGLTRL